MTSVKIVYNHITGLSSAFINGESILSHSTLNHALQTSFQHWYRTLLNSIYSEILDDYELEFVSRELEGQLLKQQMHTCPHCKSLNLSPIEVNWSTFDRLTKLSQQASLQPFPLKLHVYYDQMTPELDHLLSAGLASLPLCTASCDRFSLLDVQSSDLSRDTPNCHVRMVFLFQTSVNDILLKRFSKLSGNTIFFSLPTLPALNPPSNVYLDRLVPDRIPAAMLKWLDFECLPAILKLQLSHVQRSPETEQGLMLCMLDQISGRSFILPQDTIGLGESMRFETRSIPTNRPDDLIYISHNPQIISIEQNKLVGQGIGSCVIDVYAPGYTRPLDQIRMRCIKVVTSLSFDQSDLLLSEGDQLKLEYHFEPMDAENTKDIHFSVDDPSVVQLSPDGSLRALRAGRTVITLTCGRVSVSTGAEVRERQTGWLFQPNDLTMYEGDTCNFSMVPYPANSISSEYQLTYAGDGRVDVQPERGTITALSKGTVAVTAFSKNGAEGSMMITVKRHFNPSIIFGALAAAAAVTVVFTVFKMLFG